MKVSIIIPCYNVEEFIACCIDSFITDLQDDCEVILVNDGSTDNSLRICKKYQQLFPNIIQIVNKKNGGLSDARNAGTAKASGEYIYYLDSDDWITHNAIKELYDFAVRNNCDIVQGGFYYTWEKYMLYDNRYLKEDERPFILDKDTAMHELIRNNYIKNFAWGKLYRTDIVKKHQFPKGKFFEDSYWQHLIIHEINRYGVLPIPMYFYRQRETSISGAFSVRNLDLLYGYKERMKFIDENYNKYSAEIRNVYQRLCIQFNEYAIATGKSEIKKMFKDYLNSENIHYSHILYCSNRFIKRIYEHFFGKRLKRIER